MKVMALRNTFLLVALWLRLLTMVLTRRVHWKRFVDRSSVKLQPRHFDNGERNDSPWKAAEPGSKCIGSLELYDWSDYTLCCEGLTPCEQVCGSGNTTTRFFVCLPICTQNFQGQGVPNVDAFFGLRLTDAYAGLTKVTRYLNDYDERLFRESHAIKPKIRVLNIRPHQNHDATPRFASPFEHICGGNGMGVNRAAGTDGPSQFISFVNVGNASERDTDDCTQPFDKGQRRVQANPIDVLSEGGVVIDASDEYKAFKWCYEGGCVLHGKANSGQLTKLCFDGARTARPWPFACASRAFRIKQKKGQGQVPDDWWTERHRVDIARSCATWAVRAREVLLMPNPNHFKMPKMWKYLSNIKTTIRVGTDRDPAKEQCPVDDHCLTYNRETGTVCCSKTSLAGCLFSDGY